MRYVWIVMIIIASIASTCRAQQWQALISMDSRIGYSTNSYLNPFLTEWNSSAESTYNFTSLVGQSYWYSKGNAVSITGGLLYEPIFQNDEQWYGGLGLMDYNYHLTSNLSAGIETGVSHVRDSYNRTLIWIQPKITWFISPFTLLRLKVGSNFRSYQNYASSQSANNRSDLYGLEFETWPNYRWQLTAGLYGALDTLPSIQKGFNAHGGVGYYFRNGASIDLNLSLEQYQTEVATTKQNNGGPPMGFPPNRQRTTVTLNTDRIARLGLDGSYPLNDRFSLFMSAQALNYKSETSNISTSDVELSGGIRVTFEPKFRRNRTIVKPEWHKQRGRQQVKIRYTGEGRLYLVGDFNDWNRTGIALRKQSKNVYVTQLNLSPGAYEYKVLRIQGNSKEWLRFSDDTYTVSDGYGSKNAMLLVE